MQENLPTYKHNRDYKLYILVLQTVTVAVILIFALGIRLFGGDVYLKLSTLYHEKFDDITFASEVLEPENSTSQTNKKDSDSDSQSQSFSSDNEINSNIDLESDSSSTEEYDSKIDGNISGNITDYKSVTTTVSNNVNAFLWPVSGRVASPYGYRTHPITGEYAMHNGIDIAAETGRDIVSAFDGYVTSAGYSSSYGYYVIVAHSNSTETLYAHCSKLLVSDGQYVKKGENIALVGSTGRSTGPHLHFEIRVGGYRINPEWMLSDVVEV